MKPFYLTNAARDDLKSIARFTEKEWGRSQRNTYLKQFDETFHMLSETPYSGKDCSHIREGYRKYPVGSHVIFYKDENNQLTVIRILHKRMDIERNLQMP